MRNLYSQLSAGFVLIAAPAALGLEPGMVLAVGTSPYTTNGPSPTEASSSNIFFPVEFTVGSVLLSFFLNNNTCEK